MRALRGHWYCAVDLVVVGIVNGILGPAAVVVLAALMRFHSLFPAQLSSGAVELDFGSYCPEPGVS